MWRSSPFANVTQVVKTIVDQGHLCPLPLMACPINWAFDTSLSLFPLPDVVQFPLYSLLLRSGHALMAVIAPAAVTAHPGRLDGAVPAWILLCCRLPSWTVPRGLLVRAVPPQHQHDRVQSRRVMTIHPRGRYQRERERERDEAGLRCLPLSLCMVNMKRMHGA